MVEDFGKVKTKESYLPAGSDWYDFWTSEKISGGKNIVKETPIETIPLYVKAGAIIPFGPEVQYATEKNGIIFKSMFMLGQMALLYSMKMKTTITITKKVFTQLFSLIGMIKSKY